MIWTPSPLRIDEVEPRPEQELTVKGRGFVASASIFVVHSSTSAALLVKALLEKEDQEKDVVVATDVELAQGGNVTCKASVKKRGSYNVLAVQVVDDELQVAMKTDAFTWGG
jgi:hypothetical protein